MQNWCSWSGSSIIRCLFRYSINGQMSRRKRIENESYILLLFVLHYRLVSLLPNKWNSFLFLLLVQQVFSWWNKLRLWNILFDIHIYNCTWFIISRSNLSRKFFREYVRSLGTFFYKLQTNNANEFASFAGETIILLVRIFFNWSCCVLQNT